ncbi:uncharacterized protein [Asterias amurensis]|uniref:uncharacterized protein n=1 Tax=Asterias amurensis TaxID=7602 RepID=UPI003AB30FA7
MATDFDALLGVDSLSSLEQETNILSARSTSSQSSLDDVLGGHQTRKKKSSTLSRLKKLKKPTDIHQHLDGLSSTPPIDEIPKDLTEFKPIKQINGQAKETLDQSREKTSQRLQDGQDEISSILTRDRDLLNKKPSPSPRIKPRRFRPQEGNGGVEVGAEVRAKHNQSEFGSHPSPFGRLSGAPPLNGVNSISYKNGNTEATPEDGQDSSSALKAQRFPSPKVRPRKFHDESLMGYNAAEMRLSKREMEPSESSEHKAKEQEFNYRNLDPVLTSTEQVSSLPPVNMEQNERTSIGQWRNNQTSVEKSTEINPESGENVLSSKPSDEISEEISEDIDTGSDSDDLVIPDNSAKRNVHETKLNATYGVESLTRISADGQSDSVEISSSSISSLTDVSKLTSPISASTPTKTNSEMNLKSTIPSSDDDEDIVVSTFANKQVEEVIMPTTLQAEETTMKKLTSEEFAAELNQLSEDETLLNYNQSLNKNVSSTVIQDDSVFNKETTLTTDLESVDQTAKLANDRPTPLIVEPSPQSSSLVSISKKSYRDDVDNSVAMSEPTFGSNSMFSDTNRSFMSTGALSTITTRSARHKSYLSGGASTSGSLMSKEELERFFPDRKVKIFITTWNMCEGKVLPENLEELLLPEDCVLVQDIYVIGTQESGSDGQEWEVRLQETLGPSHVLLQSATYGVLRLLIFIRRDLIWFCSAVEEDTVSTRVFSMIKTKGAVALGFTFFGTSFLFINSHFAAGDEQNKERIADYQKIIKELQLPVKVPPTRKYNNLNTDVTTRFDCTFWCGDFNFRLVENRAKVENWAGKLRDGKNDDYGILLQHDQLKKAMEKDMVFKGFHEGEIKFLPTYKYDIGGDVYDTSAKARVPSYTDRVLCKSRRSDQIHNVLYNASNSIKTSDHKPVYAMYEVKIRPGKDDSLTSGGVFSRDVFVEANKRRAAKAAMSGTTMSQKSSTVCSVM